VYFRHDIANHITAVALAMLSSAAAHGGGNVEYVRGVIDTARAQCTSFGIEWPPVKAHLRAAMVEGRELLEG